MPKKHHNVYVIELSPEVMYDKKFQQENWGFMRSLPCYYVGMTGHSPEVRFAHHKVHYKSSRIAYKYGVRLVPELYEKYNPMTYKEAAKKEIELTDELKKKGHGVWSR